MFKSERLTEAAEQVVREIAEIEAECFSSPLTEEQIGRLIMDDHTRWIVTREETALAGYVWVQTVLDEGYIGNVAVRQGSRRRGAGDSLLDALDILAEEEKLCFLTLEVRAGNMPAVALYEKHGFEKVGLRRNYYERPKEDALIMTKFW